MYVIMPQNLPVNEKVGYANSSHPTDYSRTSYATNLYNIQQGRDESVFKYLERFKEIKSQYFNLSISDLDLANLAFRDLKSSLRDSLKCIEFYLLASVLVRTMAHELRMKKEDENNSNLMNVQSEFVASKESSFAAPEHVKHNITTILDFLKPKVSCTFLMIIISLDDKSRLRKIQKIKLLKTKTKEARRKHWHVDTR
jgi:hypothetical protein